MAKEIIWTKRANNKFNNIFKYLEKEWGEKVSKNFVARTFDIIELIAEQPQIETLEHRRKNIRGFLITKHNRLFYRITEKEIILLNFFDTRQKQKRK